MPWIVVARTSGAYKRTYIDRKLALCWMAKRQWSSLKTRNLLIFALVAQALIYWAWRRDAFHIRASAPRDIGGVIIRLSLREYTDGLRLCVQLYLVMLVLFIHEYQILQLRGYAI